MSERKSLCYEPERQLPYYGNLSAIHTTKITELDRKNETKEIPGVSSGYKNSLGGAHRADQHLTSYPVRTGEEKILLKYRATFWAKQY